MVNPFTQEQTIVSNQLPKWEFPGTSPGAWKFTAISWLVEYSPDIKWAIYWYIGVGDAILQEVRTQKTVWSAPLAGIGEKPVWSPDGQHLAVVANYHLYLVNLLGEAKPILEKKPKYEEYEPWAWSPSWSPDGQKIAFWAPGLMVYDRQAGRIVDLCLNNPGETIASPPRWSSDSLQLVLGDYARLSDETPWLVDLQKNILYTDLGNGENFHSAVWMNSMP